MHAILIRGQLTGNNILGTLEFKEMVGHIYLDGSLLAHSHGQPYGTYLILENCMFGHQTEQQLLVNFL